MEEKLTHFDEKGNAIMVDVTEKKITSRTATASGKIHVNEAVMKAVLEGTVAKGDVLGVARVAGIMAVKQTAHLIPMCHTLLITKCSVDFEVDEKELTIKALCTAKLEGKTGVEMEALTGVSVALLTIYDMCKAIDKRSAEGDYERKCPDRNADRCGRRCRTALSGSRGCCLSWSGWLRYAGTTPTSICLRGAPDHRYLSV